MILNPINHIEQCKSEMQKLFPGCSISEIRSEVVANETFGTTKYDGQNPFFIELNKEYIPTRDDHKDAKMPDHFVEIVNEMTMTIMWNQFKMIYTLDSELVEALSKTKNLSFSKDIFERIPYKGFYINLTLLPEYEAEGCLVIISKNRNSQNMQLVDIQLVGGKNIEEGDGTYEFLAFVSSNGEAKIEKTNRTVTEGVFFADAQGVFNISTDDFIEVTVKDGQALLKKTRAGYAINPENPYLFLPI